jgi:hypothetical protein
MKQWPALPSNIHQFTTYLIPRQMFLCRRHAHISWHWSSLSQGSFDEAMRSAIRNRCHLPTGLMSDIIDLVRGVAQFG